MPRGTVKKFTPIQDKEKLAYIAGILDTMASFSIMRNTDKAGAIHWSCKLIVASKDIRISNFLNDSFGMDRVRYVVFDHSHHNQFPEKNWHKPSNDAFACHLWRISGDLLQLVLESCYPWMIFKKEHAEIMMLYLSTRNSSDNKKKVSEENIRIRIKCAQDFDRLNRGCKRKNPLE